MSPTPPAPPDPDDTALPGLGLDLDVLEGAFSYYFRAIDAVVSRDLDHRLLHLPVARGKGKITTLLLVDRYPGIRPSVIAEVLMRDRPATGRIIDAMVGHGLIRREADALDQRAQALFITEDGHALAGKVRQVVRQQEAEFFDFIVPEDRAQFMRMLRRAYAGMRGKLK